MAEAQRVTIVTGTSSGMGLHAAIELARRGDTVVATVRDPARADRLRAAAATAGVALDIRSLDVTDEAGATTLIDAVARDHGGIDVLVNNAGRGSVGTAEQLPMSEIAAQLEVNYLGPVRLAKAVLPVMRAAGRGRILTVTSVGGVVGQPFADAYCGAKFAVEGFMQSLAPVAARVGVWVSVIEPAAVASDFVANVSRQASPGPYEQTLQAYLSRTQAAFANAQPAAEAGAAIAAAARSTTYRFRWQTSAAASAFVGLSLADLDGSSVLGQTATWLDAQPDAHG
ncbi:MAG TPA: SDR family NAD(P)-dependent oxidoreductase [Jatrophihabitans sp.]|nr:SDR family NAD(P)-dependent oxidoreductase [Jatrophihabitans sp.]